MFKAIYNREYFYNRSEELKNQHVRDINDLINFFKINLNLKLHIHYGTLLGAVREHNFIAHDSDIDLAYISNYHIKKEVKKEIIKIMKILEENNMLIKNFNNKGQMHIRVPNGTLVVDVFTSWIENKACHLVPFGKICSENIIYPFKKCLFRDLDNFDIPNQSKTLLNILYKNWNVPIKKDKNYLNLYSENILK